MNCCIQVVDESNVRVVRIAGGLAGPHVPDFLKACAEARGTLRVDLTELSSADAIATDALRRVSEAGAQMLSVPQYL